ncbi:hypothetical protein CF319_g7572, partial [Tilletia indica]
MRPDPLMSSPPEENAPAPDLQGPHAYQNTAEAYAISGVLGYDKDTNMMKAAKNRLLAKNGSADNRRSQDAMIARAKKRMEIAEMKKAEAAAGWASSSSSTFPLGSTYV